MIRTVRFLFATAFVFDTVLGIFCIAFAPTLQEWLRMPECDPVFIRLTGLFPMFIGYCYFLMFRDPRRFPLIQVTTLERLTFPLFIAYALLHVIRTNFGTIPCLYLLVIGGVTAYALALGAIQAYYLKQSGERIFLIR
jgi:hypothetical protein